MQKQLGQAVQDILTVPLLIGTDGKEKMSKSLGNYIGIAESPQEQFGKVMSIPDYLIIPYFELLTEVPREEINGFNDSLSENSINPRDLKVRLAKEIVTKFYNAEDAEKAEKEFNRVFKEKGVPSKMPEIKTQSPILLVDLIVENKLAPSRSEAKRLMEQGGVKLDGQKLTDWQKKITLRDNQILQVGKRKFVKISLE